MNTEILNAAERGWRLFPVRPHGKKPLIKNWQHDASKDLATLKHWGLTHPDCNWGIVTGAPSGFLAIDVDGEEGCATLADLEQHGCALPSTLAVSTGRGTHFYLRMPCDVDIRNDQSGRIGPQVDVRATGGYVIAPGSTHANGSVYQFVDPSAAIADVPKWLVPKLTDRSGITGLKKYGEGDRTNFLVSLAGWLNRRGTSLDKIESILLGSNARRCSPPLPEDKVRYIARDIFQRYPNRQNFTQDTQGSTRISREMSGLALPSADEHKALMSRPLKEYLKEIIDFTLHAQELGAGHTPLFNFTRFCKAHPALSQLTNDNAMAKVEETLYALDELPIGCDPWETFFPATTSAGEAKIDFQYSWNQIRSLPFHDVVSDALWLAVNKPVYRCASRGDLYRKFVNLAAYLQMLMKERPIFLPCRKLAPLLGCSHTTISHLASLAIEDGFLTMGEKEQFRSSGKRKAREYLFCLDVLPKIRGTKDESIGAISEICSTEK